MPILAYSDYHQEAPNLPSKQPAPSRHSFVIAFREQLLSISGASSWRTTPGHLLVERAFYSSLDFMASHHMQKQTAHGAGWFSVSCPQS